MRRIMGLGGFAVLVAALGLSGCSGFFTAVNNGTTTTGSTTYAYVTNVATGGGGSITEYSDTSGVLTVLSGSPISLTLTPTSIVVAPNNAFLFVATSEGVFVYTIGTDGTLTEGNSDNVAYLNASGLVVQSMAVDSTSSWLIVSYKNSTELDALAISSTTGVPTGTIASATLTYAAATPQVTIAPANNNVFVALGTGGVNALGFNASTTSSNPWGSEVQIKLISGATNVADNAVAVDPTSTYLYVGEASTATTPVAGKLRVFTIANLSTETDYAVGIGPSAILPESTGDYVYVANETDNTISGFSVSAGVLTELTDSPFSTAKQPLAMAEDSTKSYITVIGYGNNPNLWLYKFDSTTLGDLDVQSTTSTSSSDPALSNGVALTY